MKIIFDEDDAVLVASAMAKSRGMGDVDFTIPYAPESTNDLIMIEALRVVAAFRTKYNS